jgi:hypothetical protein
MKAAFWSVLCLCTMAGCILQANPSVPLKKIPHVSPPIQARALLLIAPSFEEYFSEGKAGFHQVRTHYGEATAKALSALVTQSFAAAEIRRLADAEVQTLFAGAADTSIADLLLVPSFEGAGARGRLSPANSEDDEESQPVYVYDESAEVKLRLNARSLRTGSTFTWVTLGGTDSELGWARAARLALEAALHAMSDSLAAHRAELELVNPAP